MAAPYIRGHPLYIGSNSLAISNNGEISSAVSTAFPAGGFTRIEEAAFFGNGQF